MQPLLYQNQNSPVPPHHIWGSRQHSEQQSGMQEDPQRGHLWLWPRSSNKSFRSRFFIVGIAPSGARSKVPGLEPKELSVLAGGEFSPRFFWAPQRGKRESAGRRDANALYLHTVKRYKRTGSHLLERQDGQEAEFQAVLRSSSLWLGRGKRQSNLLP